MSTVHAQRPRVKPPRSIQWLRRPTEDCAYGPRKTAVAKAPTTCFLEPIPADASEGQHGYGLTKLASDETPLESPYHVLLDLRAGRHACECKGHLRHGH